MQRILHPCLLALALTVVGCAGAQPTERAQVSAVGGLVDAASGQAGPLRLGMSSAEAIAAMGDPEVRMAEFLAWRGGKVNAGLEADRVVVLEISDRAFAVGPVRVGDTIAQARLAFPAATWKPEGKAPMLTLSTSPFVGLEANPTLEAEIITIHLGRTIPAAEHDEH